LDFEETEVKTKPALKVMLIIVSQTHFNALPCPNLAVQVNIPKEVLLLFLISKFGSKALHGMFPLNTYQTLRGGL